jgi:hypothetical protein
MTVRPILNPHLPPLAWGLISRAREAEAELFHGSSVFVGDGFACDGGWNAPCDRAGYLGASALFGTGVCWGVGDDIEVRSAIRPLSRFWSLENERTVVVSNSLALVLALGGSRLDPGHLHYEADLLWYVERPHQMSRRVHTADGAVVRQYGQAVLCLSQGRTTSLEPDRSIHRSAPVDSFASYRAHLSRNTAALFDNLADSRRPRTYAPLATLSSGYDSPACAVIAREHGAEDAITFREARDIFADSDDDGSQIGAALGYRVTALDRFDYKSRDGSAERWSLAYGAGGEDVIFDSCESLGGRCLVTGYGGDTVWRRSVEHHVLRGRLSASDGCFSFGEQRIQRDFVHLPLPILDCFRQPDIVSISNSAEMRPWAVGGSYDRPIPRRIAEEAGVAREWFGTLKKASSAPFYHDDALDSFGPAALDALKAWVADLDPEPGLARYQRSYEFLRPWRELQARIHDIGTRHPVPAWLSDRCRPRVYDRWRRPAEESLLAVTWAVETTREDYVEQLASPARSPVVHAEEVEALQHRG